MENDRGAGFLISNKWSFNLTEFIGYNKDRIATAKTRISNSKILTTMQVYLPTAVSEESECNEIYMYINEILGNQKCNSRHQIIIMGDFNNQIGETKSGENKVMGTYNYENNIRKYIKNLIK